nr:Rieske 2Fe-2S domain-containing protein [uncultured Gellertiella sp.]
MTPDTRPDRWEAVALSRSLRARPMQVIWNGKPVVLFRGEDGVARALQDRCPHRQAPLSGGKVVGQAIECPYHGWQFRGDGTLATLPCHVGDLPRYAVPAHAVKETAGLLFLARGEPQKSPYISVLDGPDTIAMRLENRVRSTVLDVAENILDATHTHFTHKGLLRGLSAKRYRVNVTVTAGGDWVEAIYEGEPKQEGLVSKLLEGERSKGVARFLAPGIAELEFWGNNRLNLATTFHLRQETAETVHGLAILSGPRQGGLGYLKAALLRPFFKVALGQDQRILHAAKDNAALFDDPQPLIGPLDILRLPISQILKGERPAMAGQSLHQVMEL